MSAGADVLQLRREPFNGVAFAVGLQVTVAVHGLLLGAMILSGVFRFEVEEAEAAILPEAILEEEDVIEARFVELGVELDPNVLPNRRVPILPTAAPVPVDAPSANPIETDVEPVDEAVQPEDDPNVDVAPQARTRPLPEGAVEDLLANIEDRAEAFAERAERLEQEGDPEGIEGGTERSGTEGDRYAGRFRLFLQRGWSVPTTLNAEAVQGLTAIADVDVGSDLRIAAFRIRQSSGNPVFDQSVIEQLTRLQAAGTAIPPPPEEVAHQYLRQTVRARFNGRNAR